MEGYGPPRFSFGDQWEMYQERLEQYFLAADVDEERKSAVLLTSISLEVYQTVKNICHPLKPNGKTYDELCALLKSRFCPTMITYRERATFYRARQETGDSVQEWYVRLKKLSLNCEFGEHLDHALKDIFVTGLQPGPIFERLCEEEDTVALEVLLKLAAKREATLKNRGVLEVNKISEKRRNYEAESVEKTGSTVCNACGKKNHDFRSCQYRSYICKICKEIGHIAVVCPKKQPENSEREDCRIGVNHLEVKSNGCSDPYFVNVAVNGRMTKFVMDTGSPITMISEAFYQNQFEEFPLHPFRGKLVFYTGEEATPKGTFEAMLAYEGRQAVGQVVVIEGGRNPLIGRDFIGELLNLQVNKLDTESSKKHENKLTTVMDRYGQFKYAKVSFQLKQNAKPKFLNPRRVQIPFQFKVEDELEKLEKTGIISKAETDNWGTPFFEDKRFTMSIEGDVVNEFQGEDESKGMLTCSTVLCASDNRDPNRQRWSKAKFVRRKDQNMKYEYAVYEEEGTRREVEPAPDDEYLSADDNEPDQPQPDQQHS